ncbi:hypothetical protein [Alteromonas mediterranea]|uniref:hypothetical protein n=1 Tax=Alteromonas mediterranea TaxID=314275 RepID=UPI000418DB10
MKFDSIKSRLVLMTLICVIGMGVLVVSQHYFTQQLISLNQQRDDVVNQNHTTQLGRQFDSGSRHHFPFFPCHSHVH